MRSPLLRKRAVAGAVITLFLLAPKLLEVDGCVPMCSPRGQAHGRARGQLTAGSFFLAVNNTFWLACDAYRWLTRGSPSHPSRRLCQEHLRKASKPTSRKLPPAMGHLHPCPRPTRKLLSPAKVSPFSPSFWFNYEFFTRERVDGHESAYAAFLLPGVAVLFVTLVFPCTVARDGRSGMPVTPVDGLTTKWSRKRCRRTRRITSGQDLIVLTSDSIPATLLY
ncbi:hypothetical protein B0H13DRAFT_1861727 [Mycena leptocephala]|nr:hypothetical protein B0H13DRAFT_1861727 [Mycena leptocephala]